jgi:acylphosphatase
MKVRAHLLVSGRVQGVFFRSETRYEARRRNVTGWIRNLTDGRVEAVFEGEKNDVEKVIDFCHKGPPASRVRNVEVEWKKFRGEFYDFKIRHSSRR